ncbi:MAG: hypothetical protein RSC06_04255 [Clostridia bacterium]
MKSKFNVSLLIVCLLVLFVPAVLIIALGGLYAPGQSVISAQGGFLRSIAPTALAEYWHSMLMLFYIGGVALVFLFSVIWILRQSSFSNYTLYDKRGWLWLRWMLIPTVVIVVAEAVAFTVLFPLLAPKSFVTFWPWLLLLVQVVSLYFLQIPTQKKV